MVNIGGEAASGGAPGGCSPPRREQHGDGLILSQESPGRHEPNEVFHSFSHTRTWEVRSKGAVGDSRNLAPALLPEPSPSGKQHSREVPTEHEQAFKPPVSVIVIQKPQDSSSLLSPSSGGAPASGGDGSPSPFASSLPSSFAASASSASSSRAGAAAARRPRAASLSYSSGTASASSSEPFRLQPRNPPKLLLLRTPPPLRHAHSYSSPPRSSSSNHGGGRNVIMMSGSHRGRKRRAHSMSTYPDPCSLASTTFKSNSASASRGGAAAGGAYFAGAVKAGSSVATETTVRESLLGTPLQEDSASPSSAEPSQSSTPPGRVLPAAATAAAASSPTPFGEASSPASSSAVAAMNFQGLSLLSPGRGKPFHHHGSSSHLSYKSPERDCMSVDGSAAATGAGASPASSSLPGSQASHARSCFSKYRHHQETPSASASSLARAANSSSVMSPYSAAGGSPKIAPLIVLGPKSWLSSSASPGASAAGARAPLASSSNVAAQLESAAALMDAAGTPSPDARSGNHQKKRPPLHQHHAMSSSPYAPSGAAAVPPSVNWMQSLDGSAASAVLPPCFAAAAANDDDDPATSPRFLPPSTVLCHPSTPGSTLSVEGQPRGASSAKPFSVLTFRTASRGGSNANRYDDDKDDEELMSHPDACGAAHHMTPPGRGGGSRVRRQAEESPGKRSVMSMSPTSTPLPRLTLTPRSTTSSHAARQLFLSLPTPGDIARHGGAENDATQAASARARARAPSPTALPSPKRNSYIPLPEWASSGHSGPASKARADPPFFFDTQNESDGCGSDQYRPTSPPALLSTSLLSPPSPNDAIERFLNGASYSAGMSHQGEEAAGHNGDDNDSLSASDDDDEAFFLATPLAIQEERQSTLQQSKHRKLRDQSHASLRSHHSFASSNIMQASSTSLRGMNFVTSCTSLDKIGSMLSSGALCLGHVSSLRRQDSQTSIGLTLEGTNAPSNEESTSKGVPSSFSNSAMGVGRDLVTPPVMAQPKSPPPLPSPRIDTTTSTATLPRSLPNHRNQRCEDMMDQGGPNWSSPSPPPSSSTHRPWPCSGEAESPMDRYTTRVLYTSTAPDRSPSD